MTYSTTAIVSRKAWCVAFLLSFVVHAALAFSFDPSRPGQSQPPAGPPISVAGSLDSILGGIVSSDSATEKSLQPVAPKEIQAVTPAETNAQVAASDSVSAPAPVPMDANPTMPTAPLPVAPDPIAPVIASAPVEPPRPPVAQLPATKATPSAAAPTAITAIEHDRAPANNIERKATTGLAPKAKPSQASPTHRKRTIRASASQAGSDRSGSAGNHRGGGGRSQASAGSVANYGATVRSRILSNRPAASGAGRVVVSFGLSASGTIRYARIAGSSGNPGLDRAALAAVRRSAPFPRPPAGASSRQLSFSIPFSFR
jgi:protein TonB